MKTVGYHELRHSLTTGSVVLFDGKGAASSIVKSFSCSRWSHVGLVVRSAEWDMVLLFESTKGWGPKDVESESVVKGVRIVPLSETMAAYDGTVAIRVLTPALWTEHRAEFASWRRMSRGRPYEKNMWELFKAAYDGPFGKNVEALHSLFCSELVAESFQKMGLLSEDKPSNEYTPGDFANDAKQPLRLLNGYRLLAEVEVA